MTTNNTYIELTDNDETIELEWLYLDPGDEEEEEFEYVEDDEGYDYDDDDWDDDDDDWEDDDDDDDDWDDD